MPKESFTLQEPLHDRLQNLKLLITNYLKDKSCTERRFRNQGSVVALMMMTAFAAFPARHASNNFFGNSTPLQMLPMAMIGLLMSAYLTALKMMDGKHKYLFFHAGGINRFMDLPIISLPGNISDEIEKLKSFFKEDVKFHTSLGRLLRLIDDELENDLETGKLKPQTSYGTM